jgi:S-formylglutathione hydrolase FrmB
MHRMLSTLTVAAVLASVTLLAPAVASPVTEPPAGDPPVGRAQAPGTTPGALGLADGQGPNDIPSVACIPRSEPIPEGDAMLVDARPAPGAEDRIVELTLHSPALNGETRVNVLLPQGYTSDERYPVLYLLHGAAGNHRDWQTIGAVQRVVDEATTAHGLPPFLVVMPDAGAFGFYSDWFGVDIDGHNGPGPAPAWTTYHIRELVPWVDANLPTISDRSGRAVAGLSMGGFGTMSYATRFPDLFAAAGSFSGALNPSYGYPTGNAFLTGASGVFTGRGFDQCIWGEFSTQKVRWLATDPTYLAGNLRNAGATLYVASGGGDVDRPEGLVTDPVEQTVYLMSKAFADALAGDGVPHSTDFYAEGGHAWVYWQQGLGRFLPMMVSAFENAEGGAPASFDHRSAEPEFSAWDWRFAADRLVTEFLYLTDVGRHGLTARGSGQVEVESAGLYAPGATYLVAQDDEATSRLVADDEGRLRFTIDLGPSHTVQQMVFDEEATARWRQATVTIMAVPRRSRPVHIDSGQPERGEGARAVVGLGA